MNKQHIWHKEIKAWSDGAEIEYYDMEYSEWKIDNEPNWYKNTRYRIKPEQVETETYYEVMYANEKTYHIVNYLKTQNDLDSNRSLIKTGRQWEMEKL